VRVELSYIQFPDGKGGFFSFGKKIKELRKGIHKTYVAQARPQIDAARTEMDLFQRETI
jgi:hypothetical protein